MGPHDYPKDLLKLRFSVNIAGRTAPRAIFVSLIGLSNALVFPNRTWRLICSDISLWVECENANGLK